METLYEWIENYKAQNILNQALNTEGFIIWVKLPNGEIINIPSGSEIHTANYSINISE